VVAFSSGNHAQGVAAAAQLLGLQASIVMPADAPAIKVAKTKAYGAEVVLYDRHGEDREKVAADLAAARRAELVRPYDDPDIIAGQGTVGLEIAAQCRAIGAVPDLAIVPCGGGGLIAGTATALKALLPTIAVHAAEPAGFDDTMRSLAAHRRIAIAPGASTICDALMVNMPGEMTFGINDRLLAGGVAVSDAEVEAAMAYGFRQLKLVIEPGGAVALAALLSGKFDGHGRTIAVVCSGGNVDPATFGRAIASGR